MRLEVCESEILIDYILATTAARGLGLGSGYFKQVEAAGSPIHHEVMMAKQCGMLFVKLPKSVMDMLREGYTGIKITSKEDEQYCDHFFQLAQRTKIGFYK